MKKALVISLLLSGLLFSCSGKDTSNTENNEETPAQTITYEENGQGLAFYPLDDGTYRVGIGNAYYLSNIVVPSTHNGKAVTKVINCGFSGEDLYEYEPTVKSITLPETITEIGKYGISCLEHLESIKLPKSLTKIGDYGLDDNYALKEIQYNGTADEFNQIEFGKDWLLTEGYDEGVELSFAFTDKSVTLDSLFNQLTLLSSRYPYEEETKTIETIDMQFRVTGYAGVYCFTKTSIFGNLYKRAKNCTMSIENPDIACEYENNNYEYESGFTFYIACKGVIGSTRINFTCNNSSASLIFNVTPDISITVANALALISEFKADRHTYYSYDSYYYCVEAFVAEIIDSQYISYDSAYRCSAYIKDNIGSESKLYVAFTSSTEITQGTRIRIEGCRFSDNYGTGDYYFSSYIPVTILS